MELPIKVRYNRFLSISLLVVSVTLIAIRIYLYYKTGLLKIADSVILILLLYAALRYLTSTFFELHQDHLIIYFLGGPIRRKLYIGSAENLIFEGTNVYLTYNGKRKKIPMGSFFARKEDWRKFKVYVTQQLPGGELHNK